MFVHCDLYVLDVWYLAQYCIYSISQYIHNYKKSPLYTPRDNRVAAIGSSHHFHYEHMYEVPAHLVLHQLKEEAEPVAMMSLHPSMHTGTCILKVLTEQMLCLKQHFTI